MKVFGVTDFRLPREGVFDLWVFKKEVVLPLSEVIRQLVVGLFTHHIFFNVGCVFDFFQDGVRVQVCH